MINCKLHLNLSNFPLITGLARLLHIPKEKESL